VKQKLLLVEPNPRMLDVLQRGTSELAEARHAGSLAEAQQAVIAWSPDLILCEYRLGDGTGLDLLEQLRPLGDRAPTLVMIASRADTVDRLNASLSQFEEVVQKPFLAADLRERVKRVLTRISLRRAGSDASPLRGRLEDLGPVDLLQALDLSRKSCAVVLARSSPDGAGQQEAVLYLNEGQVRDAVQGSDRGEAVVYAVLGWKEGDFAIDFNRRSSVVSVKATTQGLLMEGLRLLDESNMPQGA